MGFAGAVCTDHPHLQVLSPVLPLFYHATGVNMRMGAIYAGLALAILMKLHPLELSTAGSNRALWLWDAAQLNME